MELLYFILGFISATYLIPLFDGISAWFLTWVEVKKAKFNEVITQINIKMRQAAAAADDDDSPKRLIGFCRDDDDYEEEEDDEE